MIAAEKRRKLEHDDEGRRPGKQHCYCHLHLLMMMASLVVKLLLLHYHLSLRFHPHTYMKIHTHKVALISAQDDRETIKMRGTEAEAAANGRREEAAGRRHTHG